MKRYSITINPVNIAFLIVFASYAYYGVYINNQQLTLLALIGMYLVWK